LYVYLLYITSKQTISPFIIKMYMFFIRNNIIRNRTEILQKFRVPVLAFMSNNSGKKMFILTQIYNFVYKNLQRNSVS